MLAFSSSAASKYQNFGNLYQYYSNPIILDTKFDFKKSNYIFCHKNFKKLRHTRCGNTHILNWCNFESWHWLNTEASVLVTSLNTGIVDFGVFMGLIDSQNIYIYQPYPLKGLSPVVLTHTCKSVSLKLLLKWLEMNPLGGTGTNNGTTPHPPVAAARVQDFINCKALCKLSFIEAL